MHNRVQRTLACVLMGLAMVAGVATTATVRAGDVAGFTLPANSAYCEPGYLGPFVGCTPWAGLEVTFESSDGSFSDSCVTVDAEPAAGCSVVVPFGSTITASIDPADIPDGFVLQGETSVQIEIPDGPPEGEFGGAVFVLFAEEDGEDTDDGVSELPDTGAGTAGDASTPMTAVAGWLAAVAVMLAAGALGRRRQMR